MSFSYRKQELRQVFYKAKWRNANSQKARDACICLFITAVQKASFARHDTKRNIGSVLLNFHFGFCVFASYLFFDLARQLL